MRLVRGPQSVQELRDRRRRERRRVGRRPHPARPETHRPTPESRITSTTRRAAHPYQGGRGVSIAVDRRLAPAPVETRVISQNARTPLVWINTANLRIVRVLGEHGCNEAGARPLCAGGRVHITRVPSGELRLRHFCRRCWRVNGPRARKAPILAPTSRVRRHIGYRSG